MRRKIAAKSIRESEKAFAAGRGGWGEEKAARVTTASEERKDVSSTFVGSRLLFFHTTSCKKSTGVKLTKERKGSLSARETKGKKGTPHGSP